MSSFTNQELGQLMQSALANAETGTVTGYTVGDYGVELHVAASATVGALAELLLEIKHTFPDSYRIRTYDDFGGKMAVKVVKLGTLRILIEHMDE